MERLLMLQIKDEIIICAYCNRDVAKRTADVKWALKEGRVMFCDRTCFGLYHRCHKSKEQLKEEKRLYDMQYREKNRALIKKKKQAYNESPAGRAMQKKHRDKWKQYHLEYCRTPEYREWKKQYDVQHRAKKRYGELWESDILTKEILNELEERYDMDTVRFQSGRLNKSQIRKRKYGINSTKLEKIPLGNAGAVKS